MNFDYFFTGKMAREEAASAFLAMALDSSPEFRKHFLRRARLSDAEGTQDWAVSVEDGRVDVTLRSSTHVIIVENKIDSGALRIGQLLGYYEDEVARSSDRAIRVVMLAPGGVGSRQVAEVASCAGMQERHGIDRATGLSWADLVDYDAADDEEWLRGGLDAIERAIERAATAMYPALGSRAEIRRIVDAAANELRMRGTRGVMRWSAKEKEAVVLTGLNMTVNVWLQFTCADGDASPVIDTPDAAGHWTTLRLHVKVKPLGALKAKSPMKLWWKKPFGKGSLALPSGAVLTPVGGGWLGAATTVTGDATQLQHLLVARTVGLVRDLSEHLTPLGLELSGSTEEIKGASHGSALIEH